MLGPPVRVDDLDFRILHALFVGEATDYFTSQRTTAEEVARRLGIHRNTASARIARLAREGFCLPPTLDVEPSRFGLVGAKVFLDVPPERRTPETLRALFHIEGSLACMQFAEGWDMIAMAEDEASLRAKVELAKALTGAPHAALEILTSRDYPVLPPARITPLDARLLVALLRDARASFRSLAPRLGSTPKTLRLRWERLRREGLVFVIPGGHARCAGMALAYLAAEVPRDGTKARARANRELLALLPDHVIRMLGTRDKAHFFLWGPSHASLEAQAAQARKVEGVREVTLRVWLGSEPNPGYHDWLARVLERRAAAGAR